VAAARGGGRGGAAVKSPEVSADGRVTFRLRAPNAREVAATLAGNSLPMERNEQGVWSVISSALTPGIYTYSLVVDGTSINDPNNRQVQTSFTEFQSMFVVPGPTPGCPRPTSPREASRATDFTRPLRMTSGISSSIHLPATHSRPIGDNRPQTGASSALS
jgi:hypothetical protein